MTRQKGNSRDILGSFGPPAARRPGDRLVVRRRDLSLRAAVIVVLAGMLVLLASCDGGHPFGGARDHHDAMHGGRDARGDAVVEASGEIQVSMAGNRFEPGNLRVPSGTTVTWVNRDRVAHTATDRDGGWDSGILREGETAAFTFAEPGIYEYFCIPHPRMRARIEVTGELGSDLVEIRFSDKRERTLPANPSAPPERREKEGYAG